MSKNLVELISENVNRYYFMHGCVAGGILYNGNDIKWIYTGNKSLNRVLYTNVDCRVEEIISKISSKFRDYGVPFKWIVSPLDKPHNLRKRLSESGFVYKTSLTGMSIELSGYKPKCPFRDDIRIHQIDSDRDLARWTEVLCKGFGLNGFMGGDIKRQFAELFKMKSDQYQYYLAFKDNTPVATCKLYFEKSTAGIFWVSTIPEYRKQNVAGHLVQYALGESISKGYGRAILQSSEMAVHLYQKIGFTEQCKFYEYVNKDYYSFL